MAGARRKRNAAKVKTETCIEALYEKEVGDGMQDD